MSISNRFCSVFGGFVGWFVRQKFLCVFCDVFVASHYGFSVLNYRLRHYRRIDCDVSV